MTLTAVDTSATAAAPSESGGVTDARLIYFSSSSDNTHRFVQKLDTAMGEESARIPLLTRDPTLKARQPFVLVLPTYGGISGRGAVPKQVIKFLNDEENRSLIRGVIGAGNTNFGETYCLAADVIAAKCGIPVLYRFELMGTSEDVDRVAQGLEAFWI